MENSNQIVTTITTELQKFNLSDAAIAEMQQKYMPLKIEGINDKDGYKTVREARLFVKGKRVAVENRRKELKEDYLKIGRAIDGEAKRIFSLLEPIEEHLEKEQQTIDADKKRIKDEGEERSKLVMQSRIDSLISRNYPIDYAKLFNMSNDEFVAHLEIADAAYRQEQERAAQEAEDARIKREEEEKAEHARLEEQKIVAAAERAKAEEYEAHLAEIARQQQEEKNKLAEKEREIAQNEADLQGEKDKLDRHAEIEVAKRNAAQQAILDAEIKAKKESKRKAEEERNVREESLRIEALMPDKEKLQKISKHFAHEIDLYLATIKLETREAKTIMTEGRNYLLDAARYFENEAEIILENQQGDRNEP